MQCVLHVNSTTVWKKLKVTNNPYSEEQFKWLEDFKNYYRLIANGTCMETINARGKNLVEACEGSMGFRHAISKRHLKLMADSDMDEKKDNRSADEARRCSDILTHVTLV